MSVDLQVDSGSVSEVIDHLDTVRDRIFAAVREGMQEAVQGLAGVVAGKFGGDPLFSRSGDLLSAVLASPRVWESPSQIGGNVGGDPDGKPLDIWLEYGHEFPGKRNRFLEEKYLRKHPLLRPRLDMRRLLGPEERVPPHKYLHPSLDEFRPTFLELIQERVADAIVD